ncbi:uncharacterized protein LOC117817750 [Notolabrus celidotus]|uniref:uncharacterized protein LOC117817750 n=1 Tax=Notolabrus celidotus TaxID=1203425 RepID=UPI00148FA49A|nr:uncharacterized protein LOC117817750 [Notolabrus celidotus]XP_034546406.1 uncharacterized protein LOC117817750 [Notolabrus celidotus]
MTFNLNFLPVHRSKQVLKTAWGISSWCWPGSVTEGGLSASKEWLRRFLLLKLVTVLLFQGFQGAQLPLLVSCAYSLQALLLLRSPHISIKPSTVLLGQLALADGLVLLSWTLQLGANLNWWMEEAGFEIQTGLMKEGASAWRREAVSTFCEQLLDAHHLASLLLLGLVGLEATLVSRWPQQTRRFRTSHWAQLSCRLVWILVLTELLFLLHSKLLHNPSPQTYPSTEENPQTLSLGPVPLISLPAFSPCLRRTLWLLNLRLHYVFLRGKPKRRKSSYH